MVRAETEHDQPSRQQRQAIMMQLMEGVDEVVQLDAQVHAIVDLLNSTGQQQGWTLTKYQNHSVKPKVGSRSAVYMSNVDLLLRRPTHFMESRISIRHHRGYVFQPEDNSNRFIFIGRYISEDSPPIEQFRVLGIPTISGISSTLSGFIERAEHQTYWTTQSVTNYNLVFGYSLRDFLGPHQLAQSGHPLLSIMLPFASAKSSDSPIDIFGPGDTTIDTVGPMIRAQLNDPLIVTAARVRFQSQLTQGMAHLQRAGFVNF